MSKKSFLILFIFSLILNQISGKTYFKRKRKNLITAHRRSITDIDFSPDSKYLVSCSFDRQVKIWHSSNLLLRKNIRAGSNWITAVAYSHDGKYIASAGHSKKVKIWNADTGRYIKTFYGHDYAIDKVKFTPDSENIASFCFRSKTMLLHNVKTGKLVKRFTFKTRGMITSCAFSPDFSKTALGVGKHVSIWNLGTQEKIKTFTKGKHMAGVKSIVFSPDGKFIASGGGSTIRILDGSIKIWQVSTGELIKTIKAHESDIYLSYSPDGKYLISASTDRSIKIWVTKTWSNVKKLTANYEAFWSVKMSPDGKYLAAGSVGGYIAFWRTAKLGIY